MTLSPIFPFIVNSPLIKGLIKKCKSFDSMHWGSPEINNILYNSKVLLPFVLDNKTFNFEGNKNEEIKHEIIKE